MGPEGFFHALIVRSQADVRALADRLGVSCGIFSFLAAVVRIWSVRDEV